MGRAFDPGAVASWWSYLAGTAFDNLWVDDVGSSRRTATATAALTAALVNPHRGPLDDPLLSRLSLGNAADTSVVRTRSTGTGAFTAPPTGNTCCGIAVGHAGAWRPTGAASTPPSRRRARRARCNGKKGALLPACAWMAQCTSDDGSVLGELG